MIGVVVSKVAAAGFPMDNELASFGAVLDPIRAHVYCFGSFFV